MLQLGQGIRFGGRCLWQDENDTSVSVSLNVDKFIVVASAYFIKFAADSESEEESS